MSPALFFEIILRLEKWHDGKIADEMAVLPAREPGLAREHINREQVGEGACHAHDERADALVAVVVEVLAQHAIAIEHGIRLGADARVGKMEGPGAAEFLGQKFHPALLAPLGEVGFHETGGREDLIHRAVVEGAILANIQGGEMKPKTSSARRTGQTALRESRSAPMATSDSCSTWRSSSSCSAKR